MKKNRALKLFSLFWLVILVLVGIRLAFFHTIVRIDVERESSFIGAYHFCRVTVLNPFRAPRLRKIASEELEKVANKEDPTELEAMLTEGLLPHSLHSIDIVDAYEEDGDLRVFVEVPLENAPHFIFLVLCSGGEEGERLMIW